MYSRRLRMGWFLAVDQSRRNVRFQYKFNVTSYIAYVKTMLFFLLVRLIIYQYFFAFTMESRRTDSHTLTLFPVVTY